MYGDSITQGMVSRLPVTSAFGIAALATHAEIFNLGIGGAKLIPELATTIPQGHFDLVSIAYGSNDFNQGISAQQYQDNARDLVGALLEKLPQAPILLISTLTWASRTEPNSAGVQIEAFREALEPVVALSPRVRLVDGTALVPDDESMFVDKIHPNDQGFAIYGKLLARHAEAALNHT
jgi:lysophospholipase L1-like esterase